MTNEEILSQSHVRNEDKKVATKAASDILKTESQAQNIDKNWVKKAADYLMDKGKGWSTSPLAERDPTVKYPDKIAAVTKKFAEMIQSISKCGQVAELQPYLDALESIGITVTVDIDSCVADEQEMADSISSINSYKITARGYAEEIKEEDGQAAEDNNFVKKGNYGRILSVYEKKRAGKDTDDEVQEALADMLMTETALNLVNDLTV